MSRRIDRLRRGLGRNPAAVVVLQWVAAGVARHGRLGVRQGCHAEAVRWRRGLQGRRVVQQVGALRQRGDPGGWNPRRRLTAAFPCFGQRQNEEERNQGLFCNFQNSRGLNEK